MERRRVARDGTVWWDGRTAEEIEMDKCWRKTLHLYCEKIDCDCLLRWLETFGYLFSLVWTIVYGAAVFEDNAVYGVLNGEMSICTDSNTFLPIFMMIDFSWWCVWCCWACCAGYVFRKELGHGDFTSRLCCCQCLLFLAGCGLVLLKMVTVVWNIVDYFTIKDSCVNYIQTEGSQFLWDWYLCNLVMCCVVSLFVGVWIFLYVLLLSRGY